MDSFDPRPSGPVSGPGGPSAVIFPGLLCERVGMGRALAASSPAADRLLSLAERTVGPGFRRVLFEGPADILGTPLYAQCGVLTVGMMASAALAEAGLPFGAAAGYSLGVFPALVAAGSLSPESALRLILRHLELYERHLGGFPGAMGAVTGLGHARLEALCRQASRRGQVVVVGNHNNGAQFVVTGHEAAVERVLERAAPEALGIRRLAIDWPVHSPYMEPLTVDLRRELPRRVPVAPPRLPVYSAVTGEPVTTVEAVRELIALEVSRPVRWDLVVRALRRDGFGHFYECGPGTDLGRMVRWIDRRAVVRCVGEGVGALRRAGAGALP